MDESLRDVDLLALAVEGRGDAFGQLFRRHATVVYNHCFRRLGSWSAAEDATSLVFLEMWRQRDRAVHFEGSLVPWLLGVANNVVRNLHRARRRYDAALFRIPPPSAEPDPADDVAQRLDDESRMRAVLRELSRLNRGEQDVVAMVLMSGLSYAEAATALDIPIGTVRSRLARARKRLESAFPAGRAPVRLSPCDEGATR
ncbi:RNA polymerase sigma factor [Paractinoplanes rhizophilus]|uniref:RNA polymerase sigma factor n=1 Tax=Paractinoplanes rhizophilus TaxID=1416877 RepID=A0ABW2HY87_9ACTN